MPKCLDCGEEVGEENKYCPNCGSPLEVRLPSDAELRRAEYEFHQTPSGRSTGRILMILILIIFLILFVFIISRIISAQLEQIGSGFY